MTQKLAPQEAASAAAAFLARALQEALVAQGAACAALSGGATPKAAYERLVQLPLDWPNITFLQVDERCVPQDALGLNADMLRKALAPALSQGAKLLPLWRGDQSPEKAATEADALYSAFKIDTALIGMGLDGHAASWFPNTLDLARAIDPQTENTVIKIEAPGADVATTRLTMTLPALIKARRLVLLIFGPEKRAKLDAALDHETPQTAPILALLRARPDCLILSGD